MDLAETGPRGMATASTDMGNVSQRVRAIHPYLGIGSLPAVNHQPAFAAATVTPAADRAVRDGAVLLAQTAIDAVLAGLLVQLALTVTAAWRRAVGNFAFMGANAVMVLFVRETLHLGVAAYGLYLAVPALGGLGGSVVAGFLDRRLGTGGTLTLTAAVEAVALLGDRPVAERVAGRVAAGGAEAPSAQLGHRITPRCNTTYSVRRVKICTIDAARALDSA